MPFALKERYRPTSKAQSLGTVTYNTVAIIRALCHPKTGIGSRECIDFVIGETENSRLTQSRRFFSRQRDGIIRHWHFHKHLYLHLTGFLKVQTEVREWKICPIPTQHRRGWIFFFFWGGWGWQARGGNRRAGHFIAGKNLRILYERKPRYIQVVSRFMDGLYRGYPRIESHMQHVSTYTIGQYGCQ